MLLHLPWHKLLKGHLGTQQTRGSGVTGNARNAVSQLRANVEKTTDAAVAEGQKNVQAAADAGARYIEEAKSLASNAISTATVCLSISLRGSSMILTLYSVVSPCKPQRRDNWKHCARWSWEQWATW
jgi:hypothetical protein